ncbi:MAG: aminotransferase class I/II-fold pyridoxal phosphate-dependent enzyme [Clostridiales bacterium]|jgi:threonine aldolase|nr:aminotransferase class I/II-fold pyridoxal phosphate-dependent enzyme [Clostridiales bacterium]
MVSFECDYIAGAHPEILRRLTETNMESLPGYGFDHYTESAKAKIRKACGMPDAEVEFLVGGTQTNSVVISTMLNDWEGVISAESGHVSVHESGAIEYTGNKVITLPAHDGKLRADDVRDYLENFYKDVTHDHMVFPGMVYVSHPTEPGTLYTKKELEALADVCHEYDLPLYLDGARLGYGLMSDASDMTLEDIARITDVFYIGGTKVGALCGEAVVFTKHNRPAHFMTSIKKRGALLAKGRLLGIQFDTLFTDDLYFKISRHAIDMALKVKEIIKEKGWKVYMDSPTNQQLIIMTDAEMEELGKSVVFDRWGVYDDTHTIVRLATSWSTSEEDIKVLADA